jgi:DNA-binding MarR family transcriptional regulator
VKSKTRLANEAWEALFRAQSTLVREFIDAEVWGELGPSEYGVLYALSGLPDGARISELQQDVLLTQTGMSRLIARLERRGLVERANDPDDGRARRIQLTERGVATQREVGLRHGRHVAQAMTRGLDRDELVQLRDLCRSLTTAAHAPAEEVAA